MSTFSYFGIWKTWLLWVVESFMNKLLHLNLYIFLFCYFPDIEFIFSLWYQNIFHQIQASFLQTVIYGKLNWPNFNMDGQQISSIWQMLERKLAWINSYIYNFLSPGTKKNTENTKRAVKWYFLLTKFNCIKRMNRLDFIGTFPCHITWYFKYALSCIVQDESWLISLIISWSEFHVFF